MLLLTKIFRHWRLKAMQLKVEACLSKSRLLSESCLKVSKAWVRKETYHCLGFFSRAVQSQETCGERETLAATHELSSRAVQCAAK